jgi:hypothetical protein
MTLRFEVNLKQAKDKVKVLSQVLTQRIKKESALRIGEVLKENAKQNLLTQGKYSNEPYKELKTNYAKSKISQLISAGKLPKLGAVNIVNGKRFYLNKVTIPESLLEEIKSGKKFRILQLTDFLFEVITQGLVKVNFNEKDAISIKFGEGVSYAGVAQFGRPPDIVIRRIFSIKLVQNQINQIIAEDISSRVKKIK